MARRVARAVTPRPAARLAVLGSPIAHSKSPVIHAAAYAHLGLSWGYEAIRCEAPELEDLLSGLGDEWRGLSLTMPLKEEARRLAVCVDEVARDSGIVNTLLHVPAANGEHRGWYGFNTDVAGLADALKHANFDVDHVLVLGAGATAVSAVLAARSLGTSRVTIAARKFEAALQLVTQWTSDTLVCDPVSLNSLLADVPSGRAPGQAGAQLDGVTAVISTLPGQAGSSLHLGEALYRVPLFDVAYDPWPSPLAARWREHGGTAHSGLTMLVGQAIHQVRIFVHGDPSRELPDEAGLRAVMERAALSHVGG